MWLDFPRETNSDSGPQQFPMFFFNTQRAGWTHGPLFLFPAFKVHVMPYLDKLLPQLDIFI